MAQVTPPKNQKRRIIRTIIVLLTLFLVFFLRRHMPLPTSGAGHADGWMVRLIKQRAYATVDAREDAEFTRVSPENFNGWQTAFRDPVQDFDAYRASGPMRPTAARKVFVLQPIGPFDEKQKKLLADVAAYCGACFQLPVRVEKPLGLGINAKTRPAQGVAAGGVQYDASAFIYQLHQKLPPDAAFYVGVTMADLGAGDLNFVFGQGSLDFRVGIYSLCRYFPEFSGRKGQPGDEKIGLRRSCQVLAHETGHLLGMPHCLFYKCVMNGSNGLGDADAAPLDFCPICHRKLLYNLGCDPEKRFADLLKFHHKHGLIQEEKWMNRRLDNWRKLQKLGRKLTGRATIYRKDLHLCGLA